MKYTIMESDDTDTTLVIVQIIKTVNKLIQDGWQPLGGLSITSNGEHIKRVTVAQTLVKMDPEDNQSAK